MLGQVFSGLAKLSLVRSGWVRLGQVVMLSQVRSSFVTYS